MKIKNILKSIWELPQNALGYIVYRETEAMYTHSYKGANVYAWCKRNGLSLGKHIFVPIDAGSDFIKHEYGHTTQSRYLGWFYLLVIGLPSLIWCGCFEEYRKKHGISYYSFYTEKWADKLGGVER